jgi:hypothetical protein
MAKNITVEISPDGSEVSVDLTGFKGVGCKAVAKAFDSLGKVTKDVTKPEYHQGPGAGNTITAGR